MNRYRHAMRVAFGIWVASECVRWLRAAGIGKVVWAPSRKCIEKAELEFRQSVGVAAHSLSLVLSTDRFKDLFKSVLTLSSNNKISPKRKGPPVYSQMGRWEVSKLEHSCWGLYFVHSCISGRFCFGRMLWCHLVIECCLLPSQPYHLGERKCPRFLKMCESLSLYCTKGDSASSVPRVQALENEYFLWKAD